MLIDIVLSIATILCVHLGLPHASTYEHFVATMLALLVVHQPRHSR